MSITPVSSADPLRYFSQFSQKCEADILASGNTPQYGVTFSYVLGLSARTGSYIIEAEIWAWMPHSVDPRTPIFSTLAEAQAYADGRVLRLVRAWKARHAIRDNPSSPAISALPASRRRAATAKKPSVPLTEDEWITIADALGIV